MDLIPGARPDRVKKNKQSVSDAEEEDEEDDFIVDDAGQSPTTALPSAFSMNVHQDITHHFKIACQYFVHLAVTPAKKRSRISKELLSRPGTISILIHITVYIKLTSEQMNTSLFHCPSCNGSAPVLGTPSPRLSGSPNTRRL